MFDDYISVDSTPLFKKSTNTGKVCHLLWGDGVILDGDSTGQPRVKVKARGGRSGWVERSALNGQSLLEFYFIDVGQGDGILIKTPGFRHILLDGGYPRSYQDTRKNAADFVDWKFFKDYGKNVIEIDAMIASHCDADHYGGLWDLLNVEEKPELDAQDVRVDNFYHAGLSWWKKPEGGKFLGESVTFQGDDFWTRLLEDRAHALSVTGNGAGDKLHGWWHDFIKTVLETKDRNNQPTPIHRLSHKQQYLPQFESNAAGNEPSIRILGPVEFENNGQPIVRRFSGGTSINTNGVSLLLRVDYGRTRVLLTGDLNKKSQQKLLSDYAGQRIEFLCDVAKACHHGSEDVSYKFLQAMNPAATIISSGDNEGYDHPRPSIIAASATAGHVVIDESTDDLVTPLIYSTELGRSVDLGYPKKLEVRDFLGNVTRTLTGADLGRARLEITKAKKDTVYLGHALVVGGLIYGLVNVRTDGEKLLFATLNEGDSTWNIQSFLSRF